MDTSLSGEGSSGLGCVGGGVPQPPNKPPTHAERIHELNCARYNHQERISQLEALTAYMASELGIVLPPSSEKISPSPSW
jgi:hypothetical protein